MVEILFCTRAQTTNGDLPPPQQVQGSLDEILQDLENQVHHYIRLVPTIRKFLQLGKWTSLGLEMFKNFC